MSVLRLGLPHGVLPPFNSVVRVRLQVLFSVFSSSRQRALPSKLANANCQHSLAVSTQRKATTKTDQAQPARTISDQLRDPELGLDAGSNGRPVHRRIGARYSVNLTEWNESGGERRSGASSSHWVRDAARRPAIICRRGGRGSRSNPRTHRPIRPCFGRPRGFGAARSTARTRLRARCTTEPGGGRCFECGRRELRPVSCLSR